MDIPSNSLFQRTLSSHRDFFASCLNLDENTLSRFERLIVTIQKQMSDDDRANGRLRLNLEIEAILRQRGETTTIGDKWNYLYEVSIATPTPFVLILASSNQNVSISDQAKLTLYSPTLIRSSVQLNQLMTNAQSWNATKFLSPIWVPGSLSAQGDANQLAQLINASLQATTEGWVITPSLNEAWLPQEIWSENWDEPIDYYYVYNETLGYPLPQSSPPSALSDEGNFVYNDSRAQINQLPDGNVLTTIENTCNSNRPGRRGDNPYFFWYGRSKTLTVNFSATNRFICASVYASRLTIRLEGNRDFTWIGQIYTRDLIIEGNGHLHLINPLYFRAEPAGLNFPIQTVTAYLLHHRVALGKRWFLPLIRTNVNITNSQNSPLGTFLPNKASSFLTPCGNYQCWPPQLNQWDWNNLYNQQDWDQSVVFWVRELM